jgi:hypothetical protein
MATALRSGCYHWRLSPPATLVLLVVLFLATSVLSWVTGSSSVITAPVVIGVDMEPHWAIATNLLALTVHERRRFFALCEEWRRQPNGLPLFRSNPCISLARSNGFSRFRPTPSFRDEVPFERVALFHAS